MLLPTGEFKYVFKPDPPKPKPPFDAFWELLGKFIKAFLVPAGAALLIIYCTLEIAAGRNPLEQILPGWLIQHIPGNTERLHSYGTSLPDTAFPELPTGLSTQTIESLRLSTYRILVFTTADRTAATRAIYKLKQNRLWASSVYRQGRYFVLVSDLISRSQARRALQIVQSAGYEEARILSPGH